jgi:hypothetical protein
MKIQELLPYIVVPMFFLVGLYLIGYGSNQIYLGIHSWNWPCVSGAILTSRLGISQGSDGDVFYYPRIKYQYWVYGMSYTSTKIFFGDSVSSSSHSSNRRVKKFYPGKSVRVYYYPRNPRISVLEPGLQTEIFLAIGFGALLLRCSLAHIFQEIR